MNNLYIKFSLFFFFSILLSVTVFAQETVRDDFDSASYSLNTGSSNWITNWIESNDDNSALGGRIDIIGSRLRFEDISRNSHQIKRSADISAASSATLSFDWETVGLDRQNNNRKEQIDLQISISATGPFTTIGTFDETRSGSFSMDISSYISGETTIRFINTSNWQYGDWEAGEYVYIDNVVISYVTPSTVVYCSANGDQCDEFIERVQVGSIDNANTDCSGGYDDFTYLSTTMNVGVAYPITVTNGNNYNGDQCGIWVDWNQDGDFDDNDETIIVSGGTSVFTASITPPASAVAGNTRARIRILWTGVLESCGAANWGEVEDYTINVVANSLPTITSFTPENACSNSNQVVTISGTHFTGATTVQFNGVAAASYTVNSSTQISATLPSAATSGVLTVTTPDGTTTSTQSFTVNPLPAAAGIITGTDIVLPGDTKTYVCAAIADATSYEWTITGSGASITNNGSQADITFAANASPGDRLLTVKGMNACGSGLVSATFTIYIRPSYACQTTVINWDFDSPDLAGASWRGYSTVNGWQSSLNNIEIWKNGFMGITTVDGGQFCELNSVGVNEMWQDMSTIPGSKMRWEITYRYRSNSSESIRIKIGAVGSLANIADISNNNSGWVTHSGFYTVPAGQTTTQFRIATLTPSGSSGNLIDNIQFYSIEPDIEDPTFDCPPDTDGDGFIVSECIDGTSLIVNNIGVTNIADNCTPVGDLIIEYKITNKPTPTSAEILLENYGDDPAGTATSSDASGYAFPLGESTVTYKIIDASGHEATCLFKIELSANPKPVGIFYE